MHLLQQHVDILLRSAQAGLVVHGALHKLALHVQVLKLALKLVHGRGHPLQIVGRQRLQTPETVRLTALLKWNTKTSLLLHTIEMEHKDFIATAHTGLAFGEEEGNCGAAVFTLSSARTIWDMLELIMFILACVSRRDTTASRREARRR